MQKIKFPTWIIIFLILFCFNACKEYNETNQNNNSNLNIQSEKKELNNSAKNIQSTSLKEVINEKPILKIDTSAILEWIKNTRVRTLPYYDSTNFDNVIEETTLNDETIQFLHLKKIYPYEMENVERIWLRDEIELSDDFLSFIFCYQPSENELFTTLVNYTKDIQLIDFETIAYDEIAESCFRIETNFEKSKIKVFNFDYCFDNKKKTKEYSIEKSGFINQL